MTRCYPNPVRFARMDFINTTMTDMRRLIALIESTERLDEYVNIDSDAFRSWFSGSKVVDAHGNPQPVYHGTARPDRVGTVFKRSRATAGPMAYFTDDPEVASNYATSKPDTSFDGEPDYSGWFKVKFPGQRSLVDISRSWYWLTTEQRARIAALAPRVTRDDDNHIFLDDESRKDGLGNYEYQLRDARGNCLAALVDGWLSSGALHGYEDEFLQVLKLAGYPYPVEFHHPHATYPAVYAVYLYIRSPLDTATIPQNVVDALTKVGQRQRVKRQNDYGTQWDKKTTDAREWIRSMLDSIENRTNTHWTVIPDWVTATLQSLGYDGIKDTGGKQGGVGHTVWIPFTETQVKSAISNTKFDPTKTNILK